MGFLAFGGVAMIGPKFLSSLVAAAVAGGPLTGVANAQKSQDVTKATFAGEWPLTVDKATMHCDSAGLVYVTVHGRAYGIVGAAQPKYGKVDPIWAEGTYSPRVSISDLIAAARKLCR